MPALKIHFFDCLCPFPCLFVVAEPKDDLNLLSNSWDRYNPTGGSCSPVGFCCCRVNRQTRAGRHRAPACTKPIFSLLCKSYVKYFPCKALYTTKATLFIRLEVFLLGSAARTVRKSEPYPLNGQCDFHLFFLWLPSNEHTVDFY
jgi:hypothetical protein